MAPLQPTSEPNCFISIEQEILISLIDKTIAVKAKASCLFLVMNEIPKWFLRLLTIWPYREIWKYVVKAFVLFVKTVIAIQAMLKTMTEAARVRE